MRCGGRTFDDDALGAVAAACPQLIVLRLVECPALTAAGAEAMRATGCACLRRLVLTANTAAQMGDAALAELERAGCEVRRLQTVTEADKDVASDMLLLAPQTGSGDSAAEDGRQASADDGATNLQSVIVHVDEPPTSGGCCLLQ